MHRYPHATSSDVHPAPGPPPDRPRHRVARADEERSTGYPWWMWMLSGIGAYATTAKALQFIAAAGRQHSEPRATSFPEPGSPDFMYALSAALDTPLRKGGAAQLLINGTAFFPALFEAIAGARSSIHLMSYIWKPGAINDQITALLLDKVREGVEVRICVDGLGSYNAPRKDFDRLRRAGAHVVIFGPLLSPHSFHINSRNHRRAFVIDGRIGFTGGMSLSDEWRGDAHDPHHWRDTMVRVTGAMAHTIQTMFAQLWTPVSGEQFVGARYFAPLPEEDSEGPLHIGVAHTPARVVQPLMHFYWFSLRAARRRIYLSSAYFAPGRYFRRVLEEKAREGVDVRLLLPGPHTDNQIVRWDAREMYDEFLQSGVRIFEYQPTLVHQKCFLVDDEWVGIGSADLGSRSIRFNHEGMLGIANRALNGDMARMFEEDFASSHEITLPEWKRRPLHYRAREQASTLLRVQY